MELLPPAGCAAPAEQHGERLLRGTGEGGGEVLLQTILFLRKYIIGFTELILRTRGFNTSIRT